MSVYGSDIPIAVAGIVAKINVIFIAIVIGIVQGGSQYLVTTMEQRITGV